MSNINSLYKEKKLIPFLVKAENRNITIAIASSSEDMKKMVASEIADDFDINAEETVIHELEMSLIVGGKEIHKHIDECKSYIPQRIFDFA